MSVFARRIAVVLVIVLLTLSSTSVFADKSKVRQITTIAAKSQKAISVKETGTQELPLGEERLESNPQTENAPEFPQQNPTQNPQEAQPDINPQDPLPETTTIPTPTLLHARTISDTEIHLEWQIVSISETIKLYEIFCNDQLVGTATGDQYNFTVTGLAPATTYIFKIRAQGQDNSLSDYSEALSASTLQPVAIPLSPPTQLRSDVQSDTTINLSWKVSTDVPTTTSVTYEIYMNDVLAASVPGNETFYTLTRLTPGTSYSLKMRTVAEDSAVSDFSESIIVSTLSGKVVYEFENMPAVTNTGEALNLLENSQFSAGLLANYPADQLGDFVEFPFTATQGIYDLELRMEKSSEGGIIKILIDGEPVTQTLDLYEIEERTDSVVTLPIRLDDKAEHTIRFEVTDKNANSAGYSLGLDAMYLSVSSLDTYEPNDAPETATVMNVSQLYESYISSSTDRDFYKLSVGQSNTYFLTLLAPNGTKYRLDLFDANLQPLAVKQIVNGQDTDLSVYLVQNSVIYLKVSVADGMPISSDPYRLRWSISPLKQYTYDDANRLVRTEYEQGLYRYQTQYDYDRNGNLLKRTTVKTQLNP
ncbi:fibronectin type III domain-containing protein [Paenibacillus phoenicis]|uniref:Fibronectin type III domain-containing protein n=2 Tax=Paenibacillus TaxID=44249 RepID=A0ABU5PK58_9BACL|nr:fibronectin type III domain-containing protein [Paenibacillus phoenicis]MEA3570139.1 fibronectin type III domain-containing protein [Paenibacillus phoenicis]